MQMQFGSNYGCRRLWCVLLVGCLVVGCGDDDGGDAPPDGSGDAGVTTETLTDDGRVCLTNTSTNDSSNDKVEPGELRATVSFDTCLSSTCDTLESKNCTVDVSNGEVTIESSATIRTEGTRCSSDCGFVEVTCSVGSLDQGDYTLTHGSKSMDFSLPSDGAVCGAGTSPAQGASQ